MQPESPGCRRSSIQWSIFLGLFLVGALAKVQAATGSPGEKVIAQNLVFNSIDPCRVLDTSQTAEGPLMAGETRTFTVAGTADLTLQGGESATGCGIPGYVEKVSRASAIVVNLVAKPLVGDGELRLWASDRPMPKSASLSFSAKSPWRNVAVGMLVALRQDGSGEDFSLHATEQVDVIATVVGYYSPLALAEELPLAVEAGAAKLSEATETAATRDTMADLTLTGTSGLTLTQSMSKVMNSAGNLIMQMTGDSYGGVKFSLQNRFGVNGVLFEQSDAGALVDFVLKAGTTQRNFRLEDRDATQFLPSYGPEFQIGQANTVGVGPNLIVADNAAAFRRALVGIGTTSPERRLHVTSGSGDAVIRMESTSNALNPVLELKDNSPGQTRQPAINFLQSGDYVRGQIAYQDPNGPMTFRVGNATRMTLSTTGLDIAPGTVTFGSVEGWKDAGSNLIGTVGSDSLAIGGRISTGSNSASYSWNQIGTGTKDESAIADGNDLYVSNDLELDGVLFTSLGTVGAPAVAFGGDQNTGIYQPTANTLAVTTNGTERMRVTNTAVTQPNANSGMVKAAAHISGSGTGATVSRSFNNLAGGMAITVSRLGVGQYQVNFGTDVSTRFYLAMIGTAVVGSPAGQVTVSPRDSNVNALWVSTKTAAGVQADNEFFIMVY